jgi:CDP-glucose 4,6-dehydratase
MFEDIYRKKRVLITGNTGFKGSWLSVWLQNLGAEVIGLSKNVPTDPSMYVELGLEKKIKQYWEDVRNLNAVKNIIDREKPDFVFHLAAQAIVSVSYQEPVETMTSNVVGTVSVLEALRLSDRSIIAVMITSDKCYDNVEWIWGYRETDKLGGKDVYSGSKAAAEIVIHSYFESFFKNKHPVRLGIGRAGNVIGGGDWAKDRIVIDCVKSWSEGRAVEIRSPNATRPWQHVLEPLSGYLTLGHALASQTSDPSSLNGEAFNFGPRAEQNRPVVELLKDLSRHWNFKAPEDSFEITANVPFNEAGLLKLNCDKALAYLKWRPNLNYQETIDFVGSWYSDFYRNKADMNAKTNEQIASFEKKAIEQGQVWAK